jgi:stage V sporulation protein G
MNITEVRISLRDDGRLRAIASVTLDDCFVIRGLKIIEGKTGTFIEMPSRKGADGEYQDIAHPINNEARGIMERAILGAYREALEERKMEDCYNMPGSDSGGVLAGVSLETEIAALDDQISEVREMHNRLDQAVCRTSATQAEISRKMLELINDR